MKNIAIPVLLFLMGPAALSAQEPMHMDSSYVHVGTVTEDDSPVETVFRFRNASQDTLRILQLLTTCGCVKSSWSAAPVLPGQESSFSLSFAPMGRPGVLDSPAYVYYRSGDRSLMKEVRIKGFVERSADRFIRYTHRCGALRLMQEKIKMGQIMPHQRRRTRIAAGNGGDLPLTVKAAGLPGYMGFESVPEVIPPGGTADFFFYLEADKAGGGHVELPVVLVVDDGVTQEKMKVTVIADIVENENR